MDLDRQHLEELTSVIEDTCEYACEQWNLPSATIWTVVDALAEAKLGELVKLRSMA